MIVHCPSLSHRRTEDYRNLEDDKQPWNCEKLEATSVDAPTTPSTEMSTPTVESVNDDFFTANSAEEIEINDTTKEIGEV